MSPDNSASERTPLINGTRSASSSSNPHHHNGSRTIHFLTNSRYTPGTDSDNVAVRAAAYTWHVTKVTLLSST
jgi:Ca2+:H+ antiporter